MKRRYSPVYSYMVTNSANGDECKPKRKRKFPRVFCIVVAAIFLVLLYFQTNVTRVLISVSEASMRALAIEAINDAVYQTLSKNLDYDDLVEIERDENGDVSAIAANALKINKIARDTAALSQKYLQSAGDDGILIPLGALTGIEALAGVGKRISIDILPVCSVVCAFSSDFTSVGINQTKHSIYLNVIADVSIVMASRTDNFAVQTDILAGECVLVGKIPDAYLQTPLLSNFSYSAT